MACYEQEEHDNDVRRDLGDGPEVELSTALLRVNVVALEVG